MTECQHGHPEEDDGMVHSIDDPQPEDLKTPHKIFVAYSYQWVVLSQVVSSKQPKLGLTQEFSYFRISEATTGYTFTPCVGSFTSHGTDTR